MEYKYNSPIEAITSLENAYSNKDLENVLASKNFKTEAKLILKQATYKYNLDDENIINETAELLKLSLIQNLEEFGYPSFENAKREFSELNIIEDNIYFIEEKLFLANNENYINKIFLTYDNAFWKIVMIEQQ